MKKTTHSNNNKQKDTHSQINQNVCSRETYKYCSGSILPHQQHDLPQYTQKYCASATMATNIACNELWTRVPKHMPTPSAVVPHRRGCYCIAKICNSSSKFPRCFHTKARKFYLPLECIFQFNIIKISALIKSCLYLIN